MTPKFVLDENAGLLIATRLRALGYEVTCIAQGSHRGLSDREGLDTAIRPQAVVIARDDHFTSPIRHDPRPTSGIIHIVHGNLRAEDQGALAEAFIKSHEPSQYQGRLVQLSRSGARIR